MNSAYVQKLNNELDKCLGAYACHIKPRSINSIHALARSHYTSNHDEKLPPMAFSTFLEHPQPAPDSDLEALDKGLNTHVKAHPKDKNKDISGMGKKPHSQSVFGVLLWYAQKQPNQKKPKKPKKPATWPAICPCPQPHLCEPELCAYKALTALFR